MSELSEVEILKRELGALFQYIQRVRQEIAAISRPADEDHGFDSMADQLDAIVTATEKATNTIMATMEKNDAVIDELRPTLSDDSQGALLDQLSQNGATVFEACSFQDITGQRISKVVKSVAYVEARVGALIDIWGKSELDKVEVRLEHEKSEDEKLLNGPQDAGKALAQAEIDALFD